MSGSESLTWTINVSFAGKQYAVACVSSNTVEEFKQLLEPIVQVPVELQTLLVKGTKLSTDKVLLILPSARS